MLTLSIHKDNTFYFVPHNYAEEEVVLKKYTCQITPSHSTELIAKGQRSMILTFCSVLSARPPEHCKIGHLASLSFTIHSPTLISFGQHHPH